MPRYAFLIGFPITINKPEILNWIWVESLETISKTMSFVFPSPVTMGESYEKKYRNYFFKIINTTTLRWNVAEMWILKKWIYWVFNRKNYGFSVLWGIFEEYIKQNTITAVFWKSNFHSVVICTLIKKIDVREDPVKKTDSNFNFSQVGSRFLKWNVTALTVLLHMYNLLLLTYYSDLSV